MCNNPNRTTNTLVFLIFYFLSSISYSASIIQSKGNKVLINLEGEKVRIGQIISFQNDDGKVVAKAVVQQAKGERAIAVIKNGKLDGSEIVVISSKKTNQDENFEDDEEQESFRQPVQKVYRFNSTKISALLTIGINNMNTKQTTGGPLPSNENVALKSNSFGLTGAIDYPFRNWLTLRGTLGFEPFNVDGNSTLFVCNGTQNCNAKINYLSAGGFARFDFTKRGSLQLWGALGGTAKYPIDKTSSALRTDDIKLTMTFGAGGGVDYFINNKMFIPASLEYQMFESSETVSANLILLRAGFGWAF